MKKNKIKVIGILLVKNEDINIFHCINSVIEFVDKLIILDNYSIDQTFNILKNFKKSFKNKIDLIRIKKISSSHKYIEKYAGKKIWIMKVDGDEVYDKKRLKKFKKKILANKLQKYWRIYGNSFNVFLINKRLKIASGFFSPPAKLSSDLFNFNAITKWSNCTIERLHYGKIIFKKNYNEKKIYFNKNWIKSDFRSLHFCFAKRSTINTTDLVIKAPFEIVGKNRLIKSQIKFFFKILISIFRQKIYLNNLLKIIFIKKFFSMRKIEQYAKGKLYKNIKVNTFYTN